MMLTDAMLYDMYQNELSACCHSIDRIMSTLRVRGYLDETNQQREEVRSRMNAENLREWQHRNDIGSPRPRVGVPMHEGEP